jgi:hypothetical protein
VMRRVALCRPLLRPRNVPGGNSGVEVRCAD